MFASALLDLVTLSAAVALPQQQDCRSIAEASARLACYDARDTAPAPTAQAPAPAPSYAPTPASRPAEASAAAVVRADPSGRIAAVTPLRHGLFRVTLDDGRRFDTASNTAAPPAVGASVKLRRSVIGTTFLDVSGRSPIRVRLAR